MACFVAYGLHAVREPAPIFPLDLFKIHTFSVGLLGNLFARIGSGSMPYLIPLLLQVSLGYSAFEAGLMMLPVAAAGMNHPPPASAPASSAKSTGGDRAHRHRQMSTNSCTQRLAAGQFLLAPRPAKPQLPTVTNFFQKSVRSASVGVAIPILPLPIASRKKKPSRWRAFFSTIFNRDRKDHDIRRRAATGNLKRSFSLRSPS